MNLYRVTTLVRFGKGAKLLLAAPQIDARRHALEDVEMYGGMGTAVATSLIEFKVGEEIGIDHELSRVERDSLELVGDGDIAAVLVDKPKKSATGKRAPKTDDKPEGGPDDKPDDKPDASLPAA